MANEYLEKNCPLKKAKRASSRKAKVAFVPKQARQPIPASLKHQIHLRDNFQCTAANPRGSRCEQKRWLDIEHVKPVSAGGLNTLENLRTLCSFHHQLRHALRKTLLPAKGGQTGARRCLKTIRSGRQLRSFYGTYSRRRKCRSSARSSVSRANSRASSSSSESSKYSLGMLSNVSEASRWRPASRSSVKR